MGGINDTTTRKSNRLNKRCEMTNAFVSRSSSIKFHLSEIFRVCTARSLNKIENNKGKFVILCDL